MYACVTIVILTGIRYVSDYEFFSNSKFIYDYRIHCGYDSNMTRHESVLHDPDVMHVSQRNWYGTSREKHNSVRWLQFQLKYLPTLR